MGGVGIFFGDGRDVVFELEYLGDFVGEGFEFLDDFFSIRVGEVVHAPEEEG